MQFFSLLDWLAVALLSVSVCISTFEVSTYLTYLGCISKYFDLKYGSLSSICFAYCFPIEVRVGVQWASRITSNKQNHARTVNIEKLYIKKYPLYYSASYYFVVAVTVTDA